MNVSARAEVLVLAAVLMTAGASLGQQGELSPVPVQRHVEYLASEAGKRLGTTAMGELMDIAKRWESLDAKTKEWMEKLLNVLQELNAGQSEAIFRPIEAKPEAQRRDLVKKAFDDLVSGASVPAGIKEMPAVCIVIIGAGVDHKSGLGDMEVCAPRIAAEIAPFGTFLQNISSVWLGLKQRPQWIGELLTGKRMGWIVSDKDVFKFMSPTVLHFFRKAGGTRQGKAWIITSGDKENIIFDALPLHPQWDELYRPVAVTSVHLRRYDEAVRDHFLSQLRSIKNPLAVQKNLPSSLTPGKLRLDTDFDDVSAREVIKDAIAMRGGNTCDSNAFVQELAAQLLLSSINPELIIVRFGPDWRIDSEKQQRKLKDLMTRKMRDDDEAAFNVWTAFRRNPYYRRNGYFILLAEGHPGCIVVGPDIHVGLVVGARFKLEEMLPTVAHMLSFDWAKFTEGFGKTSGPIEALFRKK